MTPFTLGDAYLIIINMVKEGERYLSALAKFIGYAFWAPAGTIVFRWILNEEIFLQLPHLIYSTLLWIIGAVFVLAGYIILDKEETND